MRSWLSDYANLWDGRLSAWSPAAKEGVGRVRRRWSFGPIWCAQRLWHWLCLRRSQNCCSVEEWRHLLTSYGLKMSRKGSRETETKKKKQVKSGQMSLLMEEKGQLSSSSDSGCANTKQKHPKQRKQPKLVVWGPRLQQGGGLATTRLNQNSPFHFSSVIWLLSVTKSVTKGLVSFYQHPPPPQKTPKKTKNKT